MINSREYAIYLEQIFDDISVFYTRVNYMFLLSKFWGIYDSIIVWPQRHL
jgi:hypothetical protein